MRFFNIRSTLLPTLYRCRFSLYLCFALCCFWPTAVRAHQIRIFATVEGDEIAGHAYIPRGGPLVGVTVTVEVDNQIVAEPITDNNGRFRFMPHKAAAHHFRLALDDGHKATVSIAASELPVALSSGDQVHPGRQIAPATASASLPQHVSGTDAELSAELLAQVVDSVVSRRLAPLRQQLDAYESRIRLHDIIGGIGYIAGICGLWFFITGRRSHD